MPQVASTVQNQAYRNRDAARHGEVGFFGGSSRREMEMQIWKENLMRCEVEVGGVRCDCDSSESKAEGLNGME
jgi:hypothetical protein